jgi:tape measure domain-containing protein
VVVRELLVRMGWSLDSASQNRVEGSINRLSGMLQGLAAFASLRALAGVADSMQSLEARIGMLPQTIGDVGMAFNEVSKHAIENRQSLAAYGTMYARIGNAAKDYILTQKDLLTVSDTISQALVVGGATAQEASSAMIQFSQALGAGTLQGEEFRAMAEAAPQYMDALSEALNIPRENLKKMASEGKLTSKEVIEATLKMSSIFEQKFRQMPMTIGQATTIIKNKFSTMVQNMNRESHVVTNVANFLLDSFASIEKGASNFIGFVGGSTNALKTFAIGLAALLGPMALAGLVTVLSAVFSVGGLVIGVLALIGLAIDDVLTYLKGGQSVFGDFLKWLNSGSIGASTLQGALIALGSILSLYVVYLGTLAKAWLVVQGAALRTGIAMAGAWLIAMGPMALVLAGIAAISAAIIYMYNNWEKVKGFFVNIGGGKTPTVGAQSVGAASAGGANINSNQTINLTVPPGTPESQQAYLKNAAGTIMGEAMDKKIARDMGIMGQ